LSQPARDGHIGEASANGVQLAAAFQRERLVVAGTCKGIDRRIQRPARFRLIFALLRGRFVLSQLVMTDEAPQIVLRRADAQGVGCHTYS
jgi:hypothetical protein